MFHYLGCENDARGGVCVYFVLEPLFLGVARNSAAEREFPRNWTVFLHNAHHQLVMLHKLVRQSLRLLHHERPISESKLFSYRTHS